MASVKVVISHKVYKDGKSQVGLRFTIDRSSKVVKLFNLEKKWFDKNKGKVRKNHPENVQLNKLITSRLSEAERWLLDCEAKKVRPRVSAFKDNRSGGSKMSDFILRLSEGRAYRTKKKYMTTACKVNAFDPGVFVDQIDYRWIKKFDAHLAGMGLARNTVSKELSVIRTCLNEAVKEGLISVNPFRDFQIKRVKTFKVRLTRAEIDLISDNAFEGPVKDAVNCWLLSFYFRGMRASDVISLEWSQIKDGKLIVRADKTAKVDIISLPEKAASILNNYDRSTRFVLPYLPEKIDMTSDRAKDKINSANVLINKNLRKAASQVGIDKNLTMHTARHSFASIADGAGISVNVIKELLNHSSLDVTEGYLRELRRSKELDEAVDGLF